MNIDRFPLFLQPNLLLKSLIVMAITLGLFACGGGGGGKSKSSSSSSSVSSPSSSYSAASVPGNGTGIWPSVKVTGTQIKTLTFEWSAVAGATSYKLMKYQNGNAGSAQLVSEVNTTSATDTIGVHVHDWVNTYYKVQACNGTDCSDSNNIYTATEMIKAIGYVKASNAETGDFFGWSIALSADGNTLAVGAPAEDSKGKDVNSGEQADNTSDNSGAVYVFFKEAGQWTQQAYLKASNTEQPNLNTARFLPNDRFGYRVALSDDGNTLAVTALLEDSPSYGINCNDANYEIRTVTPTSSTSSSTANTSSISSISSISSVSSISDGDTINTYIRAVNYDVGAVYTFKRTGNVWIKGDYIKPKSSLFHLNVSEGMRFGESLALSGDGKTLAVGAKSDLMPLSGATTFTSSSYSTSVSSTDGCYEFYPSSSSISSTNSSKLSSSRSSSLSSSASSLSSTSNSASSVSSTAPGGSFSGAVYIYIYVNGHWEEEAHVKALNAQIGDVFGTSVSLSTDGNTLAVGAIGEDSIATGVNGDQADNSCYYIDNQLPVNDPACKESRFNARLDNGAAYVFTRSSKIWTQEGYLKPAHPYPLTSFGYSVSLAGDGNTLAVGAIGDASEDTGVDANPMSTNKDYLGTGAVYVFGRTGTQWAQQSFIKLNVNIKAKEFGLNVSLSQDGNTLAAGSYKDTSNAKGIDGDEGNTATDKAGAVFVYQRNGSSWERKSYVKASNTDADDRFGLNVDLSADGSTMAVGAHRESSNVTGVNGDQSNNTAEASGAVYIY